MKIGIDLRVLDGPSGQQRYLRRLGVWLGGRGHDVHLLVTRVPPTDDAVRAVSDVAAHDFTGLPAEAFRERVRDLELGALLLNPERSDAYEGIRANVLRPGYGTDQYRQKLRSFRNPLERGLRSALRSAPPVVAKRRRERAFYEGSEAAAPEVVAVSDYMRREILDTYALDPSRVHVVPNGVDTTRFSPEGRSELRAASRAEFGIPDGAVCVLMVAHNYRLKGVRSGMSHVARLRAAGIDAHLLVAGRGTGSLQRRGARRWARSMGIADVAHLPGTVHPVLRAYAAADVFLHPSWHDAFGFVVLEAMACGLPVVTTPYTGASMLVEDHVSGHVVDPADVGTVYRRLHELTDADSRRRMGDAARRVAEAHDETTNFLAIEQVLRTAVERASAPVR